MSRPPLRCKGNDGRSIAWSGLTAEFKPFQEVEVMAKVAGYVKKIYVDVGDRVQEGQLLAILEIPEMANETARRLLTVERSNAEVDRGRKMRSSCRVRTPDGSCHLYAPCGCSENETGTRCAARNRRCSKQGSDGGGAGCRGKIESVCCSAGSRHDEGRIEQERKHEGVHPRTAPFTGVVTKRYADTGSMIQAGTASQTQAMPLFVFPK